MRGSRNSGVSGPICKLEALEVKQTRSGLKALDGEVAAGRGGAMHGG